MEEGIRENRNAEKQAFRSRHNNSTLAKTRSPAPDILLRDWQMDGSDGWLTIKVDRQQHRRAAAAAVVVAASRNTRADEIAQDDGCVSTASRHRVWCQVIISQPASLLLLRVLLPVLVTLSECMICLVEIGREKERTTN
jgi:CheY-like chemotaxis protein